ncbi:MAG: glycosylhydrolase-like jelly roll fold domain-containing protein, partial [Lacunisphaera sp.]
HNPDGEQIQLTVHARWLEASACGQLMTDLGAKGYAYDLISDAQLLLTQTDKDGGLKTPGHDYRSILVPKTQHMEVATLQHLLALAQDGATVLFIDALPADVPGLGHLAERRNQFKTELAQLHLSPDGKGASEATMGKGRVLVGPLPVLLQSSGAVREPMADLGLQCIRRQLADGYAYFIVNLTGHTVDGWVPLGHAAQGAVQMNPRRGGASIANLRQHDGVTEVYLQQSPGESFFIKTLTDRAAHGTPSRPMHAVAGTKPAILDGDWHVTALTGGPVLPPPFVQHGFASWTTQGGEWERFGGTARYETEFTLPADVKADNWLLDLGDVRETARVLVNGTEADVVWSLPMRTKIGHLLKAGKNTLTLEITNLAANRIRDLDRRKVAWKNFHEINFVNIFYQPFDASNWPLQPSGLLGPVQLIPVQSFTP